MKGISNTLLLVAMVVGSQAQAFGVPLPDFNQFNPINFVKSKGTESVNYVTGSRPYIWTANQLTTGKAFANRKGTESVKYVTGSRPYIWTASQANKLANSNAGQYIQSTRLYNHKGKVTAGLVLAGLAYKYRKEIASRVDKALNAII